MSTLPSKWATLSLKYKSVLIFGGISLIPLIILSGFTIWNTSRILQEKLEVDMKEAILSKESRLDTYYKLAIKNAESIARNQEIQTYLASQGETGSIIEASEILLNYQEAHWGDFHHIFVANTNGDVVLSPPHGESSHAHMGENISHSPFFEPALSQTQLTDFFGFEESTHYHQLLLHPVKDAQGESLGVLVYEVVIDQVLSMMQSDTSETNIGSFFFATLDGREIVHSKEAEIRTFDNLLGMQGGEKRFGRFQNEAGQEVFGYYAHLDGYPMILGYEITTNMGLAELRAKISIMIFLAISCIALLVILCYWVAGYATKRLDEMAQVARKMEEGDLSIRMAEGDEDEIGKVCRAFNRTTDKVNHLIEGLEQEKATQAARIQEAVTDIESQKVELDQHVAYLLNGIEEFATGDLTVSFDSPAKGDAISKLFTGINTAIERMENMIGEVNAAISTVMQATHEIGRVTEDVSHNASKQSSYARNVSTAVEEMVSTIIENTKSAAETADAARLSGEVAREGGMVVAQTSMKMGEIAQVIQSSTKTIERLGVSSQQIGEIVSVITEIAEQTNLLALNAAIEAARAGEQGKGFAVVADEVRKLAERTTGATEEITSMIQAIQKETNEAVDEMERGNQEVKAGLKLAETAQNTIDRVVSEAERTLDFTTHIASASEEQSQTSKGLVNGIEQITSAIEQTTSQVTMIIHSVETMQNLMDGLHDLASYFVVNQSTISAGRREYDQASV